MWDLPRPGIKPVSPALAGGFLTTAPPGKSQSRVNFYLLSPLDASGTVLNTWHTNLNTRTLSRWWYYTRFQQGNWGSERFGCLPDVAQLGWDFNPSLGGGSSVYLASGALQFLWFWAWEGLDMLEGGTEPCSVTVLGHHTMEQALLPAHLPGSYL